MPNVLQTLKDQQSQAAHKANSSRQGNAVDMLSEIQSIIHAEEIKNKHRTLAKQNGSTPQALAIQNQLLAKEQ